jgi:hypothetical protein
MMMSLYEALFQSVPGAGILIGGAITALGSPRAALAVAGAGSLAITVAAWFVLAGLGSRSQSGADASRPDHAGDGPRPEPSADGARGATAPAPAVRHQ